MNNCIPTCSHRGTQRHNISEEDSTFLPQPRQTFDELQLYAAAESDGEETVVYQDLEKEQPEKAASKQDAKWEQRYLELEVRATLHYLLVSFHPKWLLVVISSTRISGSSMATAMSIEIVLKTRAWVHGLHGNGF